MEKNLVGQTLSHYHVMEEVGVGGHGVVYRAKNLHLDKDVALKTLASWVLLDEKMRARLHREARVLATLNHPNVATVHDLFTTADGTDCLIMEFVPGPTLAQKLQDGPLPEHEILELALQLGDGLTGAHDKGVVHRDLKPGNLKLTQKGDLKILDFGLAKKLPGLDTTGSPIVTPSQMVPGTPAYLAPEQLLDKEADVRTDIYEFGCVLYEMATGEHVFPSATNPELFTAILHQKPRPVRELNPAVSSDLESIIKKALEKDPDRRFQNVRELIKALNGVANVSRPSPTLVLALAGRLLATAVLISITIQLVPSKVRQTQSLAVLPLSNLSADPERDSYAETMLDELIMNIGRIGGDSLLVVSRTSVMQYVDTQKSAREIGDELDVEMLVEGTVAQDAKRVRINVRLIDARTDRRIWGKSYERELRDVLSLQRETAGAIALEVLGSLTAAQKTRAAPSPGVDPAATDAYFQGRMLWNERTDASIRKALVRFERAIAIDPYLARAHAAVADAYGALAMQGGVPLEEAYPKVKTAALRALELDNSLPEAHASLGNFLQNFEWDWLGAEREYRRAIKLNASYPVAHQWLALMLAQRGDFDAAIEQAALARRLDHTPPIAVTVGTCYYFARQYDDAIAACLAAKTLDSNHATLYRVLAGAYIQKNMDSLAIASLQAFFRVTGDSAQAVVLRDIYDHAGIKGVVRAMVTDMVHRRESDRIAAVRIAELYAYLGENDRALDWLDIGYESREVGLNRLKVDPLFDGVRSEPRFVELLNKLEEDGLFLGPVSD